MKKDLNKKMNILAIILILLLSVLNIWKSRYGFCSEDESFIIGLLQRFYSGDKMFIDEWNPAQISIVFLMPIFAVYKQLFNNNEYVFLFFRVVYVLVNSIASYLLYRKIAKYGEISLIIVTLYLLFTVGQLMVSNYNTIGLACFVFFLSTYESDKKYVQYISGIFFAISVVCVPILAFTYINYFLYKIIRKNLTRFDINFFLGIITAAIVYLIILLNNISLSELVKGFNNISNDNTHSMSFFLIIKKSLYLMYMTCFKNKITLISASLYVILLLYFVFDKKYQERKSVYIVTAFILTIIFMFGMYQFENYLYYGLIPLGIILIRLCNDKSVVQMFILGIIYLFSINACSDSIIFAASQGAMIVGFSVIIMINDIVKVNKIYLYFSIFILFYLFVMSLYGKINKIYYSKNTFQLNYHIAEGCAKGLITDEGNYHDYVIYFNEIKNNEYMHDKVLIFTNMSWMYLVNDIDCANFSMWMPSNQNYQEYFEINILKYYDMNKDKIPDTIYVPNSTKDGLYNYDELVAKIGNYQKVELMNGDIYKK